MIDASITLSELENLIHCELSDKQIEQVEEFINEYDDIASLEYNGFNNTQKLIIMVISVLNANFELIEQLELKTQFSHSVTKAVNKNPKRTIENHLNSYNQLYEEAIFNESGKAENYNLAKNILSEYLGKNGTGYFITTLLLNDDFNYMLF